MVARCKEEIKYSDHCIDCIINYYTYMESFQKVCSKQHALVWVKSGSKFWPAKVIAKLETGLVLVRFFGDHLRSEIKQELTIAIDEAYPGKKKPHGKLWDKAMRELSYYKRDLELDRVRFDIAN